MISLLSRASAAILLLPLTACMNLSGLDGGSDYACAAPKGVACDSVSGTYENSIRNNLPSQRRASDAAAPTMPRDAHSRVSEESVGQPRTALLAPDADAPNPQALRSQARYLRLWIKPWEDIDGDLFDQAHIYVQIDNGRWQIDHLRQTIRDRYAPVRPPPAASAGRAGTANEAATGTTPALPLPVQRPSGAVGFPILNNPPAAPLGSPAKDRQ